MIKLARTNRFMLLVVAATILVSSSGCGFLAQLIYVVKGHKSPAEFDGLDGKKVAVVVVSDATAYGADTLTYTLGKAISIDLNRNLKDATMVPPSKIESWIDRHGFEGSDFVDIGRGVDADMVLAVEVGSYTIHDGSTLYKGQSDLTVSVYEMDRGQIIFSQGPKDFVFPRDGRPAIQTTDRVFEQHYLTRMTQHISRKFYPHDRLETIAEDAAMPLY